MELQTALSCFVLVLAVSLTACNTVKIEIIERPSKCSEKAENGDEISMHYDGKLSTGKLFDSSRGRNQPFTFQLGTGQVILCWEQGIPGMCLGEERRLTCPPEYAYGDKAMGDVIPAKSTLVFEIKLLHIKKGKKNNKDAAPKKVEPKKEEPKKEEPQKEDEGLEHQHPDDFNLVDTSKNGEISRDEMLAYIKSFSDEEAGDGEKPSDDELDKLVADIFQTDDTNKDGVLSKEEYDHAAGGEGMDDLAEGMEVEDDLRKTEL